LGLIGLGFCEVSPLGRRLAIASVRKQKHQKKNDDHGCGAAMFG